MVGSCVAGGEAEADARRGIWFLRKLVSFTVLFGCREGVFVLKEFLALEV